jgi:hypothetical protein
MEEVRRFVDAYECATFVGLPSVDLCINKQRAQRAIHFLSEKLSRDNALRKITLQFSDLLGILHTFQEER